MNNLMNVNKVEMTSLELVKQINIFREEEGKQKNLEHFNLLNIIRNEFDEEIGLLKIQESSYINSQNKKQPMFNLTYQQAKQVLMRESKFVRRATVKYIESLENQLQNQFQVPGSFQEALLLAAEQQGKIEQLALENKEKEEIITVNKPKVGFAETIEKSKSDLLFRDMAKIIGNEGIKMGQNKLYDWCREKGLIFKKSTMPTQTAVDRKLISVSVDVFDNHENVITKITGKGQIWILDRIKQEIEDGTFYPRTVGQVLTNIKKRYRDDDEVMANKLGYSRPLMNALIKGTCNIPGDLIHRLGGLYKITDMERDDILAAQKRECE